MASVQSPRVLFVLLWRSRPYGSPKQWGSSMSVPIGTPGAEPLSHGLSNSAGFVVQMLTNAGVEAKLVHVGSDNDIWKEIQAYGATHVILEAFWCRPKKLDDLGAVFPDVKFVVRGHSSTPFLSHDTYGFKWALEYLTKPNGRVAPNDPRFLAEIRFLARQMFPTWSEDELHARVPYLPNYYPSSDVARVPDDDGVHVDVGCFGAARPFKNFVGQGIAAMMFADQIGRKLRFHVNGDRVECGGGPSVKNLEAVFDANPNAELVYHDWMPHTQFKALIASMDLVAQVSFAETFCIVAADAASQGVPIVASSEIPWSAGWSRANPSDTVEMAKVMRRAWDHRRQNRVFDADRASLRNYCETTRSVWLNYLSA